MTIPASNAPARRLRGRHRIRRGFAMPGFDRVLATPKAYEVEAILARNNRHIVGEDELEAGVQ